jgi:hypothetical protein
MSSLSSDPPLSEAPGPTSTADWNVLDKLVRYTTTRPFSTGNVTQTRSWAYDRFGFLRSAVDPETRGDRVLTVRRAGELSRADERGRDGHVELRRAGPTDRYLLGRHLFDVLLRRYRARRDARRQVSRKAHAANRAQPASVENARVEDTFFYGDAAGRLTSRVTAFFRAGVVSPAFATLTRNQTWNALGLPQTRTLLGSGASLQTTTYYTAGAPTRITSGSETVLTAATYRPHGGLASYTTGNGVTTFLRPDSHGMARPSRIETTGASANFDTGYSRTMAPGTSRECSPPPAARIS